MMSARWFLVVCKFEIEIKISATNLWINPNEMMFNDENHHWNYKKLAYIFIGGVIKNRQFQNVKQRMFWLAIRIDKIDVYTNNTMIRATFQWAF